MDGGSTEGRRVRIEELDEGRVEEWTDRGRMEGRVAAATRSAALYLGTMARVADAETLGMSMAWGSCNIVALGSLGVIQ